MTSRLIFTILMITQVTAFAWTSTEVSTKEYVFKYKLSGQTLEVKESASSYEDAYRLAAQQCFNFYKGSNKISQERGLDIIDVCANPRI